MLRLDDGGLGATSVDAGLHTAEDGALLRGELQAPVDRVGVGELDDGEAVVLRSAGGLRALRKPDIGDVADLIRKQDVIDLLNSLLGLGWRDPD